MKDYPTHFFKNKWGDIFDSYEECFESSIKHISDSDILDEIEYYIDFDEILKWAITQPEFHSRFHKEIEELKIEWVDFRLREYDFSGMKKCPINDDKCAYCEYGFCGLDNPHADCSKCKEYFSELDTNFSDVEAENGSYLDCWEN